MNNTPADNNTMINALVSAISDRVSIDLEKKITAIVDARLAPVLMNLNKPTEEAVCKMVDEYIGDYDFSEIIGNNIDITEITREIEMNIDVESTVEDAIGSYDFTDIVQDVVSDMNFKVKIETVRV